MGLADEGLTRRLKALACTAPLHDLDARKAKLDWADATIYQMAEIALHTIDQVTIAMDFDTGAGHDEVIDRLLPFIAQQAPARVPGERGRGAGGGRDGRSGGGAAGRGGRRGGGARGPGGDQRRRGDGK